MRYRGTITRWKDDKGYGFITPRGGGDDVFVHMKAFARRGERPKEGEEITYEIEAAPDGKVRATVVLRLQDEFEPRPSGLRVAACAAVWAFVVLCTLVGALAGLTPYFLPVHYLVCGTITFIVYAADKGLARSGGQRFPEASMHFCELVGGWPGAILAQQIFRHKIRKSDFMAVFW